MATDVTSLLGVRVAGRRVLVAGGGPVAARRVAGLLDDGAEVHVVAPQLCEDLHERHAAGRVTWRVGEVVEADMEGAWLVHTATGDRAVDARVAGWAHARQTWCVHAGDAGAGTASTPATSRHGDVVLGVVSSGAPDPARSRGARDALADVLRDALAGAARDGRVPLRRRRPGPGRVVLVGGGPGEVELLTLRGRRALAEADVVVTDRLGPVAVLEELDRDVEVVDVGKAPGNHRVPQEEINRILVDRARRGQVVVRLKGGDPYVLGRGGEEVLACRTAGVDVEVVPGVSSALAVPAAAGIPVTHRGTAGAVLITSGHEGLEEPARAVCRLLHPTLPRGHPGGGVTLVVLMGVARLGDLAAEAVVHGADPLTPAALVERGCTPAQRTTRGRLGTIADAAEAAGVRAPAVLVVGAVAAEGLLAPADVTMDP